MKKSLNTYSLCTEIGSDNQKSKETIIAPRISLYISIIFYITGADTTSLRI